MPDTHIVVLSTDAPSDGLENLLLTYAAEKMPVTFLEGSVLSDKDLHRAAALSAEEVFFLTNIHAAAPDEEDAVRARLSVCLQPSAAVHPRHCLFVLALPSEKRRHALWSGHDPPLSVAEALFPEERRRARALLDPAHSA